MAFDIVVERQFRFHCSCGVTIVSGERTVACSRCGAELGVRRVRRHRQSSDSIAYYGTRQPVRRIEKRTAVGAWLKNVLTNRREAVRVRRVVKHVRLPNGVPDVAANAASLSNSEKPIAPPVGNESPSRPWFEGAHVRVGPTRPDGTPHPHAGRTGRISRFTDTHSEPYWLGPPSAMVELDLETKPLGFIWVSLECLKMLDERPPIADS